MTFTITLEKISTGETAPSMLFRGNTEAEAREYAEAAIAGQPDLRVFKIEARK